MDTAMKGTLRPLQKLADNRIEATAGAVDVNYRELSDGRFEVLDEATIEFPEAAYGLGLYDTDGELVFEVAGVTGPPGESWTISAGWIFNPQAAQLVDVTGSRATAGAGTGPGTGTAQHH